MFNFFKALKIVFSANMLTKKIG